MGKKITLNCDGIYINAPNSPEAVDFNDVKTVADLKNVIIDNYVVLCRRCGAYTYCSFRNDEEDKCSLLVKFANNYIDNTIKTVFVENPDSVREYIQSIIQILNIVERFENWKGINLNDSLAKRFEYIYPKINFWTTCDLLESLSKYLNLYKDQNMERRYKFRLLVEGDCEAENLPRIINALELPFYISKDDVFNIKGAGELSKNRIELILAEYIKNNISTYVIMDNDSGTRKRLEDLVRMNLLDSNHVYIFKKAFEDSFPVEAIVRSLRMMPELELEYISSEQIKRILLSEKLLVKEIDRIQIESKSAFRLSDYKLKFSNLLSINLIELYEEGKLKRKRTEILTLLRKITKLLDQERKEFYYE